MKEYDFVVIGSGIAGLSFALKVAKHGSVAVVTKRKGADTNTAWAQGGISCVTSDEDSFGLHARDTIVAGAGLCDEAVVRTVVTEGPERIRELMQLGLQFDEREISGHRELDLGREGGHSKRRVLHVRDVTGKEIEDTLLRELGRSRNGGIELLENHMAVDLISAAKLGFAAQDRCLGVYVLDEATGEVETIRSDRIVFATGGCGKVYLYTTNPDIATGDGVAMAWRAGAEIANMEFIQFHPTCLFHPQAKSFLISEAVRGEGGILRNNRGGAQARSACFWMSRTNRRNSFASASRTFTRHACGSGSTCRSNRFQSCRRRIINAAESKRTWMARRVCRGCMQSARWRAPDCTEQIVLRATRCWKALWSRIVRRRSVCARDRIQNKEFRCPNGSRETCRTLMRWS